MTGSWKIVEAPAGWRVSLGEGWVNVTCAGGGRAVVRVGHVDARGGSEYALTALLSSSTGFLGFAGNPKAQIWVRWLGEPGEEVSTAAEASGSAPSPRRLTNLTAAPEWAEEGEIYLVVSCPRAEGLPPAWVWAGGFAAVELSGQLEWRPVPISVVGREGGSVELAGELDGVEYRLLVEDGDPARIRVEVENLAPEDRALDVAVSLPADLTGWVLWVDPRTAVQVGGSVLTRTVNSLVSWGYLPTSLYPLAAASGEVTLGIAVPLDPPRLATFLASPEFGLSARFPLGLTAAGDLHSSIDLEVEVYARPAREGMRGIIEAYLEEHPDWFSTDLDLPIEALGEAGGAERPFAQAHLEYPAEARRLSGAEGMDYLAEYVLPWEFEPMTGVSVSSPPPTYREVLASVGEASLRADRPSGWKARAALASAPRDESGNLVVAGLLRGPDYRPDEWVPRIPMNPDPDLPGYTAWDYTLELLEAALSNAEREGVEMDGVELDNFMARSGAVDPRPEALEAADGALVYDPNTLRPAAHLAYSAAEFLRALRGWMNGRLPGGGLTGNFVAEGYANFGLPYLDALPFESSPRGFNWGDVELLYRRFAAGSRVAIGVITTPPAEQPGILREFVDGLLFYGILPTVKEDMEVSGEEAALLGEAAEVFLELHSAGWRPVTGAEGEGGLLVERFGDWPSLYLTIRNPGDSEVPLAVSVSPDMIPSKEEVQVDILWGGLGEVECVRSPGGSLKLTGGSIGPGETVVVRLSPIEAGPTTTGGGSGPLARVVLPLAALGVVLLLAWIVWRGVRRGPSPSSGG